MDEGPWLAEKDKQLLAYLRQQWDEPLRLTTLEQGMIALGQALDNAHRLRVGDYLLTHANVHPAVQRWGARTLILTEDEKLLGRYLVQRASNERGELSLADVTSALGRSATQAENGLAALRHVGLLDWRRVNGAIGYTLIPNWRELVGPLGFTFHTVQRANGERFNVP